MIVEVGHYALVLAFALALVQAVLPIWGSMTNDRSLMAIAPPAAITQFLLVALSYGALTYAHVTSDFSVVNVVQNSLTTEPLIYRITGVWGSHEGSILLWVLILVLFGALVALFSRGMPADLRANVLAVQSWISAAFLLFILLTSNPFARMVQPPIEGQALNPLLQDPGLAIHPPLLYLGYVGFSITFSFAAAALISGRIDAAWARYVRPWTLVAWIFLTLGIAMGSYWAYYTLGWGGFWFWDPVENASLLPWLAGTALLHSAAVMEKRDALKVWTIFLATLAFSLSLLGTFLVRSGVLTSVHTFASDPTRGVYILIILVAFIGGSLLLFAARASSLKPGGIFAPVSREGALVLNNLLLTAACATVLVGTLYPLVLETLTGEKISVGEPFFNLTFGPLFIPIVLAMPIGQQLAWKRGNFLGAAQRLTFAVALGFVCAVLMAAIHGGPVFSVIGTGLATYLIIGAFVDVVRRIVGRGVTLQAAWSRATGLPRSAWGTSFAHAGLGLTLFGLAATGWGVESIVNLKPGDTLNLGPYQVTLDQIASRPGPDYTEQVALTTIRSGGRVVAQLRPSRRYYAVRDTTTTESGIATIDFGQVYISFADQLANGSMSARMYWKPFVALIWLGALVMGFGGMLSLSDRRLRFGVAKRAASRAAPGGSSDPPPAGRIVMRVGAVLRLIGLIALLVTPMAARAVEPDEILPNPVLEARARSISAGLRCMVCQNESIDDSQAPLAKDIRILVRQRLVAGDTDDAIRAYLVSRYGYFILLKPPFEPQTVLLWLTPALVLAGGAAGSFMAFRRRRRSPSPTDLSEIEKLRLATLLEANSTDAPSRTA